MTTIRASMRTVMVVALLTVLTPILASAQKRGEVVITPFAGAFTPTNDLGKTPNAPIRQRPAAAFGINASLWYNHYLGVELGSTVALSDAEGTALVTNPSSGFSSTAREHAYVLYGAAKAMFGLLPESSPASLRFGIGPAVITRSGTAYKSDLHGQLLGRTDVGAAMSLCSRVPITDNFGIRVRAENYLYQAKMKFMDFPTAREQQLGSRLQSDFVLSAGVQFFMNK